MMDEDQIYQEALDYIFSKLPMFTRVGAAAYKPNLDNTIQLCEELGNPHLQFKSIHITGTNGKGSCSHMLASVMQANGYKTGLYTSPHITDFRERIRINGEEIPKLWVVDFIEKLKPFIEMNQPSFFEITVGMAFSYFASQKVDIAIIEVGLGGLLDSTNIITPEVSVITNISLDHTNLLGNSIAEIATQKAGIIKSNVPVVIGESTSETENIFFTTSVMHQSPLYYANDLYQVVSQKLESNKQVLKVFDNSILQFATYELDLLGTYQAMNLKIVLSVLQVLKNLGWNIDAEESKNAIAATKKATGIRGRFDIVKENPMTILDVSHNEAGIREVMKQTEQIPHKKLHIILGFVSDKDVPKVLKLFPKKASYYYTQAQIPRALPFEELKAFGELEDLHGDGFPSISIALEKAFANANQKDIILVTGSFFTLDEAYNFIEKKST
jgi:dihydrofolate synthase/folylpolyglutamate synthase